MPAINPRSRKRAKSGTVKIRCSNDRLQLVFSWSKKRYCLSLGLSDTPFNRKQAQDKALEIDRDIQYGEFDATLAKYRPQPPTPPEPVVPSLTLASLWARYFEYVCVNASPKTIDGTYDPVTGHLQQCLTDGLQNALKFRAELLKITTQDQTRRSLMQLSAACKWGMKHGLVQANPLEGMYKDLEPSQPDPPVAFTVEERDRIIAAFEAHKGRGMGYRHYAPFVKFLFWTGCRPCEAIGLRWGSVTADCSKVHFHESIVEVSGRQVRRPETKTGVRRWFSCTPKLQEMLQAIRPEQPQAEALVFPSPKKKSIGLSNFNDRGWATILTSLGLDIKENLKMTPYNCRDTFITLQAIQGHSSTTIARWVGNSSKVIEERYLEKLKLENLRPTEI